MKELKNLQDLLYHEIQVLYSGESLLEKALPRMIKNARHPVLKEALSKHLRETEHQKDVLQAIAKQLDIDVKGDSNASMKGLIAEGEKVMHKDATDEAMDAAIICGAQKIEHYEIAGYGTAAYYAELLGHASVAQQLRQVLMEEQECDTKLNALAKSTINQKAMTTTAQG
jgi:ferritin-like metal-binding protein YciE